MSSRNPPPTVQPSLAIQLVRVLEELRRAGNTSLVPLRTVRQMLGGARDEQDRALRAAERSRIIALRVASSPTRLSNKADYDASIQTEDRGFLTWLDVR